MKEGTCAICDRPVAPHPGCRYCQGHIHLMSRHVYDNGDEDYDEDAEGELESLYKGTVLSPGHPDYDQSEDDVLSEDEQMGDYEAMAAEGLFDIYCSDSYE